MKQKAINNSLLRNIFVLLFLASGFTVSACFATPNNAKNVAAPIQWGDPFQKNGCKYIPGSVKASFGTFSFAWKNDASNQLQLVTFVSLGGGERPPSEEKLYLQHHDNGTTSIFREIMPLSNEKEPPRLQEILIVQTEELFSVLSLDNSSMNSTSTNSVKKIIWNKPYLNSGYTYIPGVIQTDFGSFHLSWKIKGQNVNNLIYFKTSGSDKHKPSEKKLYMLRDENGAITTIYKLKIPVNNSKEPPLLQEIVKVWTNDLNQGISLASH